MRIRTKEQHTKHLEYMRAWRKTHRLKAGSEARKRMNCRAYLHVYIRRGKLAKQACRECGNPLVEAHHADYSKPLEVMWLCREHHLAKHGKLRRV